MPHTLFNTEEVADYLHLPVADVEELVKRREIPFEKAAGRVMFRRRDVDQWASQRLLGLTDKSLVEFHKRSSTKVHDMSRRHAIVSELLKPSYVDADMSCRTKSSVIRHMVDLAEKTELLYTKQDLLDSILEREQLCSTALAGGMALLHPQHHEPFMFEDSFVLLGRTIQPIPFGAPDGLTTDMFFMICCQDDRLHLHVLARLCMICYRTSCLLDLREAATAADMYDVITGAELDVLGTLV